VLTALQGSKGVGYYKDKFARVVPSAKATNPAPAAPAAVAQKKKRKIDEVRGEFHKPLRPTPLSHSSRHEGSGILYLCSSF
jgi:hypothetical protein